MQDCFTVIACTQESIGQSFAPEIHIATYTKGPQYELVIRILDSLKDLVKL